MELGRNYELHDLGGGLFRNVIWQKPIAYNRGNGYRRITNQLAALGENEIGVAELFDFRVMDRLAGNAPWLFIGHGSSHLRITPLGTNNNVLGQWGDNRITYPEAWTNADLRLIMAGHRLQKDIILRTGHPQLFEWRIDENNGLDVETLETPDFRILQPVLTHPENLEGIPLVWEKEVQGGKLILRVVLPEGDWGGWLLDPTFSDQPDATDGKDSEMNSLNPTNNQGTDAFFRAGDSNATSSQARRSLLAFDYSSIPATATVSDANFELYEYEAADTAGVGSWDIKVQRILRNWVEAEVTHNVYSTGNNWTTAGCGSDGNDRSATVSETITGDGTAASAFVEFTSAQLISDIQNFIDGGYNNYGWLIHAPNAEDQGSAQSYTRYYTSDHTTAAERPKIEVVYSLPVPIKAYSYRRRR